MNPKLFLWNNLRHTGSILPPEGEIISLQAVCSPNRGVPPRLGSRLLFRLDPGGEAAPVPLPARGREQVFGGSLIYPLPPEGGQGIPTSYFTFIPPSDWGENWFWNVDSSDWFTLILSTNNTEGVISLFSFVDISSSVNLSEPAVIFPALDLIMS